MARIKQAAIYDKVEYRALRRADEVMELSVNVFRRRINEFLEDDLYDLVKIRIFDQVHEQASELGKLGGP